MSSRLTAALAATALALLVLLMMMATAQGPKPTGEDARQQTEEDESDVMMATCKTRGLWTTAYFVQHGPDQVLHLKCGGKK